MRNQPKLIVGLMSGTSADGIDAVVALISGWPPALRARLLCQVHVPFGARLQNHVLEVATKGTVSEVCELNFVLGEELAQAALRVIQRSGVDRRRIAAIASHGQTIHHLPGRAQRSTLQIGEPAVITARTGIRTIADFRVADVAAGGQGAPLVPFADWALFTDPTRPRLIQNIGGVANVTFLPANSRADEVVAFDTGPGNMVIDQVVQILTGGEMQFDRNGRLASKGRVESRLLSFMLAHPFLRKAPPKTTGREEFGADFVRGVLKKVRSFRMQKEDVVATSTAFTARTISQALKEFVLARIPPSQLERTELILGGGGAKNPTLRRMLRESIDVGRMLTHEDVGIKNTAKEALAFAILGYATLLGRPSNLPNVTGASHPAILGKIVEPSPVTRSR